MPWAHCAHADLADTVACPTCGTTKAAWTLTVEATRTFVVARRARATREKTAWLEVALEGGAGAAVEVELPDGQVVQAALDGDGRLRQEGLYPGECRVRFPGRPAAWAGDGADEAGAEARAAHVPDGAGWVACATARRHRFRAAPAARLVWPPAGEHTQWVNVRPEAAHPERGTRLRARVAVPGGAAGQAVHARLIPAAGNSRRDHPAPGLVGASAPGEGLTATLPADGGEVTLEAELGCAGGDRFELRVGTTPACADAALTITTWRRIGLRVVRTAAQTIPDLEPARAALAEVFIALERAPDRVLTPEDPGTPPGAWHPSSDLLSDGRPPGPRLVVGNHNASWLASLGSGPAPGIQLVVADELMDGGPPGRPSTQTLEFVLDGPEDPGRSVGPPSDQRVLRASVHTGGPSLIEGTWTSLAPEGHPDHGRQGVVRPEDLTIKFRTRVVTRLAGIVPGDGTPPPDGGPARHPVSVRLVLHVVIGPKEGQSIGAQTLVSHTAHADWFNATLVHELGHSLRQAGLRVAPGLRAEDHGRFYTYHGHRGPHCGHGLTDAQWEGRSYKGLGGQCVMWGDKDEAAPPPNGGRFCARCQPFVRADHCRTFGPTADDPPSWDDV